MLSRLPVDFMRWEKRYRSLHHSIADVLAQMETWAAAQTASAAFDGCSPQLAYSRIKSFVAFTQSLENFSASQFDLLHGGFERGELEPSQTLPIEYVMRRMLDQMSFDVMLVQMAWLQRTSVDVTSARAQTLRIADRLTYSAMSRASERGLLTDDSTVLTYLQKAASARVVPYAPLAVIGIPFSTIAAYEDQAADLSVSVDLLAIPHEVGHYLYRHGRKEGIVLKSRITEELVGRKAYLSQWAEEIFSDVYGTLVAGPVIALDFQDLMSDNNPIDLFSSDGEHPYAALRPLIYVDTLLALDAMLDAYQKPNPYGLRTAALVLEMRWRTILAERGYPYHTLRTVHAHRKQTHTVIKAALSQLLTVDSLNFDQMWSSGRVVASRLQQQLGQVPRSYRDLASAVAQLSRSDAETLLKADYFYTAFADWLKTAELPVQPELVLSDGSHDGVMQLCPQQPQIEWDPSELIGLVKLWDSIIKQVVGAIQPGQPFAGDKVPASVWAQAAIHSGWVHVAAVQVDGIVSGPETDEDPRFGPETDEDPRFGPETDEDPRFGPETDEDPRFGPETDEDPRFGAEGDQGPRL